MRSLLLLATCTNLLFSLVDNSPGQPLLVIPPSQESRPGLAPKQDMGVAWSCTIYFPGKYILRVGGPSNNHASVENNSGPFKKKFVLHTFLQKIRKRSSLWLRWQWPPRGVSGAPEFLAPPAARHPFPTKNQNFTVNHMEIPHLQGEHKPTFNAGCSKHSVMSHDCVLSCFTK